MAEFHDMEGQNDCGNFEYSDKSVRRGFIRKVYGVLTCQLVITFGIVAIFVWVKDVREFAVRTPALFWSAFALTLIMMIALACCGNFRRKTPYNYIALILFTLCEGYLLGCCCATFNADEVMLAVGVTIVVCLGLTLFAFQTKWDFTMMGGMLLVSLITLIMFGILAAIFQNKIVSMVYACLGALLFSFYLVFDTQLIIGGKHKLTISPEEYIFAALNLYLDVVNIFMFLLAIIGGSRN